MRRTGEVTQRGFTLIESLIALSAGMALSGSILNILLISARSSQAQIAELRKQHEWQRLTALIRSDLRASERTSPDPSRENYLCNMRNRTPVLHLDGPYGPITYSEGAPPSGIWQGRVLMRCGKSYGIDGQINPASEAQNRVVQEDLGGSTNVLAEWRLESKA